MKAVYDRMPMVHCHCFTRELKADNAKKDIIMVRALALQILTR
jgi:hypothetical protein